MSDLTGRAWTFRACGGDGALLQAHRELADWMPCRVPGTTHGQLLAAGRIPDPHFDRQELDLQWVDQLDYEFRCAFEVSETNCGRARQELVFEGLDTIATVTLNGRTVGTSVNMFRRLVCDVRGALTPGRNELLVRLDSPTAWSAARAAEHPEHVIVTSPHMRMGREFEWQTGEKRVSHRAWLRKVKCHFGWDWGLCLAPQGIWRPCRLECSDAPRVEAVTVAQRHVGPLGAPTTVELAVTVRLAHPVDTDGVVSVSCGRARVRVPVAVRGGRGQVTAALTVTSPKLWWPNGYGAQPLYPLEAGWEGGDAPVRLRLGLRTLELRTEPDRTPDGKDAESMTFVVNGRAIFAKGANWIPPDQLVERCTPDVYRHLLQSMAAAHMNMVRVWGGGWYELDEFYAACDELGLLVWQDFMMACMLSPDTPEFIAELVAEAREQVHRLQHHACVALWCGDNEVLGFINAWWKNTDLREAVDEPYRRVMTALRDAVTEADATRRFWVSSPSNGWIDPHSESPHKGDVHYWRVWHGQQPFSDYRTVRPRFCSEFGFQSFPEPRTLRACVPAAGLNPSSWHMEHHQRSHNGNQYIMNALARELPIPHGLDGYCWASQINHANAIRTAVEHWRRTKPWCAGILYWQLNDLWPVASWSSIDYHGRWKALHHAATRFYAPLLATGVHDPAAGTVTVWATSDVPRPLALRGRLTAMTWAGEVVGAVPLRAHLPPDASAPVATVELTDLLRGQAAPREVCLFVELAAGRWRARNHLTLVPWKHVALPRPKLRAGLVRAGDGLALNLRTDTVAAFVHAEIAGTESHFAGSFDVLRPDETYVWPLVEHRQRGQAPLTLTAARRNLRVFSLYDLIWRDA